MKTDCGRLRELAGRGGGRRGGGGEEGRGRTRRRYTHQSGKTRSCRRATWPSACPLSARFRHLVRLVANTFGSIRKAGSVRVSSSQDNAVSCLLTSATPHASPRDKIPCAPPHHRPTAACAQSRSPSPARVHIRTPPPRCASPPPRPNTPWPRRSQGTSQQRPRTRQQRASSSG